MEKLLTKYIQNECSSDEEQRVIDWLQNPINEARTRRVMWKQWNKPATPVHSSPDWQDLWSDITEQTTDLCPEAEQSVFRTVVNQLSRTVIWLGCIIVVGMGLRMIGHAQTLADTVYETNSGQKLTVKLPDQSKVALKGNSSLEISSDWSGPNCNVWLKGEGVFSIQRQVAATRLLIHTSDQFMVETKGADFSVSHQLGKTRISVKQGSVYAVKTHFFGTEQKITLQEGDWLEYDEIKCKLVRRHMNPPSFSS